MRILNAAIGAVLLILIASPALASDPRGGGGPHGGGSSCGGGCGGGGHPPPPPPPPPPHRPPHGGGFNGNINVNVNANANANANAFAGAGAGGHFNARAYDVGGIRGGGGSYGAVYVGGGYGGDGGYYGGGAIYNEEVYEGRACASAPFGYVVAGFGRNGRRAPACVANSGECRVSEDRGGRYGHSERRDCGGGRRESYSSYEGSSHYESRETWREESSYSYVGYEGRRCGGGCDDGGYTPPRPPPPSHDCGCDHGGGRDTPYPPRYIPEPPRRYEPAPVPPSYPRPRHDYRQEPGERG